MTLSRLVCLINAFDCNTSIHYYRTKIQDISKNSSIIDLVSGKLPNQLIQAVFQLVKENSRLNTVIGSKLDMKILDKLELNSIVRCLSAFLVNVFFS